MKKRQKLFCPQTKPFLYRAKLVVCDLGSSIKPPKVKVVQVHNFISLDVIPRYFHWRTNWTDFVKTSFNFIRSTWIFVHSLQTGIETVAADISFSIFEKWMCSSFFATSSKASFSLRTLFVSRFRILKASLTCWFTSSRASSLGELCSSSDLRDNDIFLVIKRRFTQECREYSETRAILFVC